MKNHIYLFERGASVDTLLKLKVAKCDNKAPCEEHLSSDKESQ